MFGPPSTRDRTGIQTAAADRARRQSGDPNAARSWKSFLIAPGNSSATTLYDRWFQRGPLRAWEPIRARVARPETDYALLPSAHRRAVSARRDGAHVVLLDLLAARIPRWPAAAGSRLHFPAPHHDRIRVGTEQRDADGGDQSFVAPDRGSRRSGRAGRRSAPPVAALSPPRRRMQIHKYDQAGPQ